MPKLSRINRLVNGRDTGPLVKKLIDDVLSFDGKSCPVCGFPLVNLTPKDKRVRISGRTIVVESKFGHRLGEDGCMNRIHVKLTLKAGRLFF